jgi:hypothetical protein
MEAERSAAAYSAVREAAVEDLAAGLEDSTVAVSWERGRQVAGLRGLEAKSAQAQLAAARMASACWEEARWVAVLADAREGSLAD